MSTIKQGPITLSFPASGGNTQSATLSVLGGTLSRAIVVAPNFTNDVTLTFAMKNAEGKPTVSVGGIPKNADTALTPMVGKPHMESWTLEMTTSGDPGGSGGDVLVTLYWEE